MKKKEMYLSPTIEVTEVELEQGIATSSGNVNNEQEEWEEEDDDREVNPFPDMPCPIC